MGLKVKTFEDFKSSLEQDSNLQDQFREDPVRAVQSVRVQHPAMKDKVVYRLVVASLGAVILLIIIGVIALMLTKDINKDTEVPTLFTALGSAAIGALAGLLAPSPSRE